MSLNFDPNRNLMNRTGQDAAIKDQERKEKNRFEIANEEQRDKEDFSYEAQRRKKIVRNITGVLAIILIFYVIFRFATGLF